MLNKYKIGKKATINFLKKTLKKPNLWLNWAKKTLIQM